MMCAAPLFRLMMGRAAPGPKRAIKCPSRIATTPQNHLRRLFIMAKFDFTNDTITCAGRTFPVKYSVTPSGSVMVFVTMPDSDKPARVRFTPKDEAYPAALAAAKGELSGIYDQPETPANEPAPVEIEQPAEEAAPVEIEQPTPRAVPEKAFIGETISGKGWRILFDGEAQRTRVCFDAAPTDAARAAVEKAGFYFSAALNSYNKKLTFKAHRAAVALSGELAALYA